MDDKLYDGLVKLKLPTTVSKTFVAIMRYLEYIKICVCNMSTLLQIEEGLRHQLANAGLLSAHYLDHEGVRELLQCMASSIKQDTECKIAVGKFYSTAEDGQLNKQSACGFIVTVWVDHKSWHLFIAFVTMLKSPALPMSALNTINTGVDSVTAQLAFMKSVNRSPAWCSSTALDGQTKMWVILMESKAKYVEHICSDCLLLYISVSCDAVQIGECCAWCRINRDVTHKADYVITRMSKSSMHVKAPLVTSCEHFVNEVTPIIMSAVDDFSVRLRLLGNDLEAQN